MSRNIKEQDRTKHIIGYFELHPTDWIPCSDAGLCNHLGLIYNGVVPLNKRLSTLLSLYYREGLLIREFRLVKRTKAESMLTGWKGKTKRIAFYKLRK